MYDELGIFVRKISEQQKKSWWAQATGDYYQNIKFIAIKMESFN